MTSENLPRKWADEAMFEAEPHTSRTPEVHLLWMTPDPLGAVAAMAEMYKGNVIRDLSQLTDEQRMQAWDDVQKTHLKAPLEAVKLHFMIENVDRAFTHQMVRQRTAVYAQESLRFAVVDDLSNGTSLPPSLEGTKRRDPMIRADWYNIPENQRQRDVWDNAIEAVQASYDLLIRQGMPAEEARGLLPHATLTRLNYVTDLRALMDHAGNRLCTQAQFVWRMVFAQIAQAIADHGRPEDVPGDAYNDANDELWYEQSGWQQDLVAGAFRPVCYQLGRCPFQASFDRHCSIRERVQANAEIGRPSSEWDQEHDVVVGNPIVVGVGPRSVLRDEGGQPRFIGSIHHVEWLADPSAARKS